MGACLSSAQQNYVPDLHFILTRPSEVDVQPPMAPTLHGLMPTNLLLMPLLVAKGNPRLPVILPPLSELPMLKGNLAVPAAGNVPIIASVVEHKGPDAALESGTLLGESTASPIIQKVRGTPAMDNMPAVPQEWHEPATAEEQINAATAVPITLPMLLEGGFTTSDQQLCLTDAALTQIVELGQKAWKRISAKSETPMAGFAAFSQSLKEPYSDLNRLFPSVDRQMPYLQANGLLMKQLAFENVSQNCKHQIETNFMQEVT